MKKVKPKSVRILESRRMAGFGWVVEETKLECPNCKAVVKLSDVILNNDPDSLLVTCGSCECDFKAKKQDVSVWVSIAV